MILTRKTAFAFILFLSLLVLSSAMGGEHDSGLENTERHRASSPKLANVKKDGEMKKNTLIKLIQEKFHLRESRAEIHVEFLRDALKREAESELVRDLSSLVNSLFESEKLKTLRDLEKTLEDSNWNEIDHNILKRVVWVLEESLGISKKSSALEGAIKKQFGEVSKTEEKRVRDFNDNLEKALGGDETAKSNILGKYSSESLMDYMAQRKDDAMGEKMAKLLGWKDKDGSVYLDVVGTKPQTWSLGKTQAEIRTSLNGIDRHLLDLPATTEGQLNRFVIDKNRANLDRRNFVRFDTKEQRLELHTPLILEPQEQQQFCRNTNPGEVKSLKTEHRPYYFFRPFPYKEMVSYASLVDGHNRNFIMDMNTGKEKGVPGAWDPVPTPDELYMTIPTSDSSSDTLGIKIYAMADMLNDIPDPKPIYEEDTEKDKSQKPLKGVYQSIGVLVSDMVSSTYRIITDMDGLSFRDYRIFSLPGGKSKVEPLGEVPKKLCASYGENISLPMLSKDGKFVSFLDTKENVTKILEIGIDGSQCNLVGNLGVATSKVDFGFDTENPVIVFHKVNNQDTREKYLEVPSDDLVSNVYQYNLKTNTISRLTNNTDSNSIYPAFRKDGKVVYLHHPHGAASNMDSNATPFSKLVVVDPNKVAEQKFDFFNQGLEKANGKSRFRSLTAIGGLWAELCSSENEHFSVEASLMAALGLSPNNCKALVENYWEKFRKGVESQTRLLSVLGDGKGKDLSSRELETVCLEQSDSARFQEGLQGSGTGNGSGVERPRADVPKKCLQCHLSKIPWDDREALNRSGSTSRGMSFLDDILDRINQPLLDSAGNVNPIHMPRGGEMNSAERTQLSNWVQEMRN